jgi:hypothetical protein
MSAMRQSAESAQPDDRAVVAAADSHFIHGPRMSRYGRHGGADRGCWVEHADAAVPAAAVPARELYSK